MIFSQKYSKKVISAVLAGMMVLGVGGPAASADQAAAAASVSAPAAFSDVKTGLWSEKYIYQLAAQGIVTGDKGKFRPNDPVTQQEAVTMAIRFLNMEPAAGTGASTALPTNIKVNNFFVPYVKLALQQSLLDKNRESAYSDTKVTWGSKKATREWVTEILVRAIGRTQDANAAMNKATGFADNAKISKDRLGYVNVAVELGLAKGLNGNKFDPQGPVKREQLAAFFSRAQEYIKADYANQYEGYVTSLAGGKLELYVDGKPVTFTHSNHTVYFEKASEKRMSLADIKPYTKLRVIGQNGTASYIEILDPTPKVEVTEKTFDRVSPDHIIWLDESNSYEKLVYDKDTIFLDQNGNKTDVKNLASGSIISIERETFTPNKRVVAIRVKSGLVTKSGTATILAVDTTAKTITFKDSATGAEEIYKYEEGVTVFRYQNQLLTPAELKNGFTVKYSVNSSVLKLMEVTQSVDRSVQAMLYSVEGNGKTVTYKRSGSSQLETKFLADKPEIVISGIPYPSLSDLIADSTSGDQVELTLSGDEKITKIQVLSRQMEKMNGVTVVSYDPKTKWLMLNDGTNQPKVLVLDARTKLDSSSGNTLSAVEPLLTAGRKVSATHIGNRALSLEVTYKVEGKVTGINAASKILSIQTESGQTVNIPYNSPNVEVYGKLIGSMADIRIGDEVSAQLTSTQDFLHTLKAKKSIQFEIVYTEPTLSRMRVKSDGVTSELYTDKAAITGLNGESIQLANLRDGTLVNISFLGASAVKIEAVKLTIGQVTAIDASSTGLTVKDFSGQTHWLSVDKVKVVRGGSVYSHLGNLNVNDRVEVRKDVDGTTIIKVLDSITKKFWRYDGGDLYVKRTYTTEEYRYPAPAHVYVHQGEQNLSVHSLKENDNIVLYFNNGVVVEVVKQ